MSLTSFFADLLHLCLTDFSCPPLISGCLNCYWSSLFLLFPVISLVYAGGCPACLMFYFPCNFFFYHLNALWSQSFFTPWIVTLLKNLFKILSVWLRHHSVTKYFYIMASYTISAFRFNLQYCLLIIAFSVYNCHEILFSYRKKREIVST